MSSMRWMLWRPRVHVSSIESGLLRGESLLLSISLRIATRPPVLLSLLLLILLSLLQIHHQRVVIATVQDVRRRRGLHPLILTI